MNVASSVNAAGGDQWRCEYHKKLVGYEDKDISVPLVLPLCLSQALQIIHTAPVLCLEVDRKSLHYHS